MFFLVLGIISELAGAFVIYMRSDRIKNCKPYLARVINIEERTVVRGHIIKKQFRPIVKYTGDAYEQRAHYHTFVDFYNLKHKVDESLTVFVDSRISNVFYLQQDLNGKVSLGAVLFFAVGVLFIISGSIFAARGM